MLKATTIKTAAKTPSGSRPAIGAKTTIKISSVKAWIMPATGVFAPIWILAVVRAMAPVAGIPQKRLDPILAIP